MGRAPCCDKANVKKGPWSPEEDAKLKEYMAKNGTGGNWISLPHKAGLRRCGKSCRLRWLNYLRPNLKHGEFSDDEDRIICTLFATIGSRWSIIAGQLPGRTDNDIKNYWNTKLKKKLINMQAPLNHKLIPHQYPLISSSTLNINPHVLQNSSMPSPYNSSLHHSLAYDQIDNYNYTTTTPVMSFSRTQEGYNYSHELKESDNSNLLVFGRESTSCSTTSSNGSCITNTITNHIVSNHVKDLEHDYERLIINSGTCDNYFSNINAVDEFLISENNPMDLIGIEEIKQLIGTTNSMMCSDNNNLNCNFFVDEIKSEEKSMYNW